MISRVVPAVAAAASSFLILTAFPVSAQTKANKQNPVCVPEFAQLLVEQQVAEAGVLEEAEKRIKILLRAADFLWKPDEAKARKFYIDAFNTADARFKEKNSAPKKPGSPNTLTIIPTDYRMEVIAEIAKKDAELAKRFSEQVLKDFEKQAADNRDLNNPENEIASLLRIARENSTANPALSQHLFRRAMRYPLDSYWYWTLFAVAQDNQSLADSLYLELLQNYSNEKPRRLLFLSAYPVAAQRIFGIDKYQYAAPVPANLSPNSNLQDKFFNTFFVRTNQFVNNPDEINSPAEPNRLPEAVYILTALQDFEPIIMQRFPHLLDRLALAKSQANSALSEESQRLLERRKKAYENTGLSFSERLERLKKADSEGTLRDSEVIALIFNLKKESEFAEAEEWLRKIKDEAARRSTENFFYFRRSQVARAESRFDEARKYALLVEELEHRAILFFELAAERLKTVSDTPAVTETLTEVSRMARSAEDSVAKAQVLLGLAAIYEKFNHAAALDELGEAIKIINRLEKPDIFSSAVYRQIKGRDFGFFAVFRTPGYNMETAFLEISKNDFEITLSQAKNLQDRYFRTLAVIAVVKNCVSKTPPKKQK